MNNNNCLGETNHPNDCTGDTNHPNDCTGIVDLINFTTKMPEDYSMLKINNNGVIDNSIEGVQAVLEA